MVKQRIGNWIHVMLHWSTNSNSIELRILRPLQFLTQTNGPAAIYAKQMEVEEFVEVSTKK